MTNDVGNLRDKHRRGDTLETFGLRSPALFFPRLARNIHMHCNSPRLESNEYSESRGRWLWMETEHVRHAQTYRPRRTDWVLHSTEACWATTACVIEIANHPVVPEDQPKTGEAGPVNNVRHIFALYCGPQPDGQFPTEKAWLHKFGGRPIHSCCSSLASSPKLPGVASVSRTVCMPRCCTAPVMQGRSPHVKSCRQYLRRSSPTDESIGCCTEMH